VKQHALVYSAFVVQQEFMLTPQNQTFDPNKKKNWAV